MSRDVTTPTQGRVTKYVKGAERAGKVVSSMTVLTDGSIKLDFDKVGSPPPPAEDAANLL